MRSTGIVLLFLLIVPSNATAQQNPIDTAHAPLRWQVRAQFAGYQGLFSIGGGPVLFKGVWRPAIMYGLAPAARSRSAVHHFILRNDLVFRRPHGAVRNFVSPTMSANLIVEPGDHSYWRLPQEFPGKYYFTPQMHATFGIGARYDRSLQRTFLRQIGFGAEFVGLGSYIWYSVSQRNVPLHKVFGLSFAVAAAW